MPDPAASAREARARIRAGQHAVHTSGLAPGCVQGNVVILPRALAPDFAAYCQRNPKPCPLLATSEPGDPRLPTLGRDIDIRTDVPRYRVFRDGRLQDEPSDIAGLWRDDLVTFVLGCSFSFEEPLIAEGLTPRHIALGRNVSMYRTGIDTQPAGPFGGKMVVTMRPYRAAQAIRAIQITSRFPNVHGAPIHLGDPAQIGVDLNTRYKNVGSSEVGPGEVPLFWACGLTPQLAIDNAKPPFCITHAPSCMLVTDVRNASLAVL